MPTPAKTKKDQQNRKRFAKLRSDMALSFEDFAGEIGKGVRQVRYYETGEAAIPKHVEKLIDYMAKEREAHVQTT